MAPILIFLVVNRLAGLRWAVLAATVWSIKVVIDRRRAGIPLGRFMPLVTGAVIIRGVIGIVTDSETVYFGLGIASKYAIALVLITSVLIGRPLAARAIPYLMVLPHDSDQHPIFIGTMRFVTVIAGVYYAASATFDIWLFQRSSVEGYVIVRFLANWPLSAAALVAIVASLQRLQRIPGVDSVTDLVEQRLSELGMAPSTPRRGT